MARTTTPKLPKRQTAASNGATLQRDVLTLEEAAEYLRVSIDEIMQMIDAQDLPGRKFGTQWRFSREAIHHWLGSTPRKGILKHFGRIKGDPYAEEMLKDIYERRGRPETEED